MSPLVRVLIADLHSATHLALTHEIEECELTILPDFARSLDGAISMCHEEPPHILLLSLNLCSSPVEGTLLILRQQFPDVKLVALAEGGEDACLQSFIQAGIVGYFQKSESVSFWLRGLQAVAHGALCFSQEGLVVQEQNDPSPNDIGQIYGLSERECQILIFMVRGLEARQIANELKINYQTVRNYQCKIYRKLGVQCRHEILSIFQPDSSGEQKSV